MAAHCGLFLFAIIQIYARMPLEWVTSLSIGHTIYGDGASGVDGDILYEWRRALPSHEAGTLWLKSMLDCRATYDKNQPPTAMFNLGFGSHHVKDGIPNTPVDYIRLGEDSVSIVI